MHYLTVRRYFNTSLPLKRSEFTAPGYITIDTRIRYSLLHTDRQTRHALEDYENGMEAWKKC
jgi:hypothetical protein